jgi:hypothetical protein
MLLDHLVDQVAVLQEIQLVFTMEDLQHNLLNLEFQDLADMDMQEEQEALHKAEAMLEAVAAEALVE